jgi:RNA polymerase sigma-70 factor (ECF subfamily)
MRDVGNDDSSCPEGDEEPGFAEFLRRLRDRDEHAARELVLRYEPAIRRAVRLRLRDPRLRRVIESGDICQAVFASFFVRTAQGEYNLESPDQLLRLLATMARNKLVSHASRERAGRRDQRRIDPGVVLEECPASGDSPSRQTAAQELIQEAQRWLTPHERELLQRRAQGLEWAEIARELGGSPDGLRVRLARAFARLRRHLGLEGAADV